MPLPDTPTRRYHDQLVRRHHDIPDDAPCDRQHDDGDYCGGTIMAEYINRRPQWTDEDYTVLCLHHHHRRALHRYTEAFIHDQEKEMN